MASSRALRWQSFFNAQRRVSLPKTSLSNVDPWVGSRQAHESIDTESRPVVYGRAFSTSRPNHTDGVFRALTENRVQTPWVEAFERQQKEGHDPTKPSGPSLDKERDLSPKKMSDSYHSVVSTSYLAPCIFLPVLATRQAMQQLYGYKQI